MSNHSKKHFFKQPILCLSIFIAMAAAVTELPFWIIIFSMILVLWRLAHEEIGLPKLATKWTTFIGVFLFSITYFQFRTIWGQVESATILVGLISISILNYETERDHRILILLGFILAAMKPMFVIDLAWAIPSFICLIGLWISLIPHSVRNKWRFFYTNKSIFGSFISFALCFVSKDRYLSVISVFTKYFKQWLFRGPKSRTFCFVSAIGPDSSIC